MEFFRKINYQRKQTKEKQTFNHTLLKTYKKWNV